MKLLTKKIIPTAEAPERVLQFGEGNFLRAFIDWMLHRMNAIGEFNGKAVVVQPIENGIVDLLNDQDSLYTLYLRGIENGDMVNTHEVVTSISRGINPYRDWDAYLETARNPTMRFVVSNTTEAGIEYVPEKWPLDSAAVSFPAKLAAWLWERYLSFSGAPESGMVIMPCELINHNGALLRECILHHANDWKLEAGFASWIDHHCTFLNTLVDRIVPGYPHDEAASMTAELGYEDKLICAGEIFHLLVIEGPEPLKAELPFHKAGLNVIWCDDMQPYRTRKVGVLNGAHTSSVLAAFLGGVDTVREMMEDPDFGPFVRSTVFEEIVPVLRMDRSAAESFANAVMERFLNPFIRHELLSISLNSVSKWKTRVLPTVKNYIEAFGHAPERLAFSLAALIAFYKGDLREGYVVNDDEKVMRFFAEAWMSDDVAGVTNRVLSHAESWGEDLTQLPEFEPAVSKALGLMIDKGTREAVQQFKVQS
ncbi:tagaturonate reductase [Candidatus Sumerlaeota bacterium]|nr:tagaturonate reductase [Candidatus Sumerlaeota bacterium]